MITTARRALARALYARGPVCFACGRWSAQPCPGHEYGGTILAHRLRRWAPWWLASRINPLAALRPTSTRG